MALEHDFSFDGEDAIQYNSFCHDMMPGRLYRFLCSLARTKHGGETCDQNAVDKKKEECACVKVGDKKKEECACVKVGDKKKEECACVKGNDMVHWSFEDVFKNKIDGLSEAKNKDIMRDQACESIASFFYDNAIPPKVVESKEFIAMCDRISRYGVGYKPPSADEIREKYSTKDKVLEQHKVVWKKRGCTIMVDAWTDQNRRTTLNLFANSIKGTYFLKSINASDMLESETPLKLFKMMDDIVEEVGEENVVQIVTDNTPFYKAAGEMLMEKRARLYWTPCVTHCIEMILEDYEKKVPIYEKTISKGKRITTFIYSRDSMVSLLHSFTEGIDLVKTSITRCASSYLTLDCLYENKGALGKMFKSNAWKSSQFAKTSVGKSVEDVVFDQEFWKNVFICLKGVDPLIKVLRLVNSIDEPATGFIYEAMEHAKEEIRSNLSMNSIEESFMPLWKIIDERWDKQLLNPLHAAGYFLNPQYYYSVGFRDDNIITRGLHHCITRMASSPEERAKIEIQLDDFDKQANLLGDPLAIITAGYVSPSVWWADFGGGLPELQSLALRVLSLTCSSYGVVSNQSSDSHGEYANGDDEPYWC